MTAPERKAICSPSFRDCLAPAVVRFEAKVAVFMPRKPARPEKKPPVMKAKGTQGFCVCRTKAMKEKRMKIDQEDESHDPVLPFQVDHGPFLHVAGDALHVGSARILFLHETVEIVCKRERHDRSQRRQEEQIR